MDTREAEQGFERWNNAMNQMRKERTILQKLKSVFNKEYDLTIVTMKEGETIHEITWLGVWLILICVAVLLTIIVIFAENIDKIKNLGAWLILGVVCIFGLQWGVKKVMGK